MHARTFGGRAWASFALFGWLALVSVLAGAAERSAADRRGEAFLAALGGSPEARQAFVRENFTEAAIARRGVEGLAGVMAQLHADLGARRPVSVDADGDRLVYRIPGEDGLLRLTLRFGPAPESRLDGLMLQPDDAGEVTAPSVAEAELPAAIATAMARRGADGFSGAVIVARGEQTLFAQAYGQADRASGRANTLDTPINLGSMNKMFTALVIARLVEQGKLRWSDTVGQHLPDWPQATVREQVTIDHLLSHRSGLGAYWGPAHDAARASLDQVADYAALVRDQAPAFTPGQRFQYSNSGYVLLGLVAERVGGKPYAELVRELVFAPAGMTATAHYARDDDASGRAIGYLRDGRPNTDILARRGSPAGGGYSSANDLDRFARALASGAIVSPQTLATMTAGVADMGPDMRYGYGFGVGRDGERHYGHNGGAPGINASFEVFPDSGYRVIVLANTDRGAEPAARHLAAHIRNRRR